MDTEILYNDFRDGKYCAVVLNLDTKAERLLDMAMPTSQRRTREEKCSDKTCIWKVDIATGNARPLLKYTYFAISSLVPR